MITIVVIMVGIFILVLTPISHRMNHGRLAYLEEIFDFPSTYLNYMACSLPSVSPPKRLPRANAAFPVLSLMYSSGTDVCLLLPFAEITL